MRLMFGVYTITAEILSPAYPVINYDKLSFLPRHSSSQPRIAFSICLVFYVLITSSKLNFPPKCLYFLLLFKIHQLYYPFCFLEKTLLSSAACPSLDWLLSRPHDPGDPLLFPPAAQLLGPMSVPHPSWLAPLLPWGLPPAAC